MNLLKGWIDRECLYATEVEEELRPESEDLKEYSTFVVNEQVSPQQREQVLALNGEFPEVFSKTPGCTHLAEHTIETQPGVVVRFNERTWPRHH